MTQQTDEQTAILREILKWIRFTGQKEVKTVLLDTLNTEQKRLIYHLSEGSRSSAEIGKSAGVSDVTVRRLWAQWARQGIVESRKVQGGDRYKKSFDLEDFGIEIPKIMTTQASDAKPTMDETRAGGNKTP
jgi:predicted ArsR family transcriptional regulator